MRPIYCAEHAEHPLEFAPNCPDCEVEALRMDWAARGAQLDTLRERQAGAESAAADFRVLVRQIEPLREALRDMVANCLGCGGSGSTPDHDMPPGATLPCVVCKRARLALANLR